MVNTLVGKVPSSTLGFNTSSPHGLLFVTH
jgi:hypothetical protein